MRENDCKTESMFVYVAPESYVPKDHPLHPISALAAKALAELDKEFVAIYSSTGSPAIRLNSY